MKIKKIKKIENFGVYKSFDWDKTFVSSKPKQQTLKDINIIYGRNYSGKTTLSRIFRAIEKQIPLSTSTYPAVIELLLDDNTILNSPQILGETHQIRVFNSEYRKENLSFLNDTSQEGEIKAFAVIGEDNVKTNNEISKLEQILGSNIEGQESGFYKERLNAKLNFENSKKNYTTKLQFIEKKKKEKATIAENSIKRQFSIFGKVNYNVPALEADINTVLNENYIQISEAEKSECLSCVKDEKKELLTQIPFIENNFEKFVKRAKVIVQYEIGKSGKINDLLRDSALEAWMREGKQRHERIRSKICEFCGNIISNERWLQIKSHFDDESESLRFNGENLISEIKEFQSILSSMLNVSSHAFYSSLQSKALKLIEEGNKEVKNCNEKLSILIEIIENKLNNITVSCDFEEPQYNFDDLNDIIHEYNKLTNKTNSITLNKECNIESAQDKLRLCEIYEFVNYIGYNELIEDIEKARVKHEEDANALERIDKQIISIKEEINELKKKLQDVSRGAESVNKFLNLLDGLTIKLVPKRTIDGKQVYFDVERNGVPARNLSEGECSIIAFCYFIARLEDYETQSAAPLVFIDDPICSLDSNHIFFVYSLIRSHIIENGNFSQLFISTHNLDFLKYLKRLTKSKEGRDKGYNIFWILVQRKGDESQLVPMPLYLKEYVTEFEYLFSQIYACATSNGVDDNNYGVFYNFGNNARKFLELYTYFKRPNSKSEDVMNELFNNRVYTLLVQRVNNELSHLMGNLERGASSIDYKEIQQVANLIIEGIRKEDEKQYNSLLLSIGINSNK